MAELFSRVRWREGYDIAEVEAFIERIEATVEGRYVERPVTADEIRNVSFTPVRLREGYAVEEVDAFLDHAAQSMAGRPIDQPRVVDQTRPVDQPRPADKPHAWPGERPVDQAGGAPSAWPADRPVDRSSAHSAGDRRLRDAPRFTPVKFSEGYDMSEVDDFVDRVMATVNGRPVDRPVTAHEIRTIKFTPVRFREGYDVMEVDLFLEAAEGWLTGS
ncbi:DivIVA domain-containing protein [Kribbella sp. CA-294648]|uniref:DivIVA domain-containing protein n=1 Tax=Kribbella sp. CA-294648 TaxID=3239948 RepID=UPI003D8D2E85